MVITLTDVMDYAGKLLLYAGASTAVAYGAFKYFTIAWLDNKFKRQLETFKHQQNLELQRLRIEIDSLLSGRIRLQEKDFLLLPEAWQKLQDAVRSLSSSVAMHQSYPDLTSIREEDLIEFLADEKVPSIIQRKIVQSSDKNRVYQDYVTRKKVLNARNAIADFKIFTDKNGIFFPSELKVEFGQLSKLLWNAAIDKEVGHEADDWRMQIEASNQLSKEIGPRLLNLEQKVHSILRSHGSSQKSGGAS